jgi:hypothetical protein
MSNMAPESGRDQPASDRPRRSRRRALQPGADESQPAGPPKAVRLDSSVSLPPVSPPGPPAIPGAFEQAWERRKWQALEVVSRGVDLTQPLGMEPDEYRARLLAAKLVLGAQRSALPLPRFGELETRRGDRLIQLRWSDGRLVRMPIQRMKRAASYMEDA